MAQAELTAEQADAVRVFADALNAFLPALEGLAAVGVEPVDALKSMTLPDGSSLYEQMPLQIRLLLG